MEAIITEQQFDGSAAVFKALGHPARLRMVHALARGEMCVCELQELVGLDVSTVSRHLAVLKRAGVLSSRKQGNWAYYALELGCVATLLDCVLNRTGNEGE
ncbi:ArsR/SmtB family transcription factor [Pseudodesulfovibrio senegalensis]|jgi:ArsR family transcriptional regulator|uniref:Winged helix-turn-helix transcriptional regulator n=1 Tax=Pseudodesulfovibrio senegalensis TaxID=1721087 RepID=A0A6N6N2T9_9BACT|nr:metalloregulator ArsR/SmtB family transcription factor [Pseudodesulfovibrio senegalensis]KAB1441752.1 winged helix-turn-helix transcriptional regulator [Pseudodesulfovibrio senegalensis]